jgi:hypothetical protein
MRIWVAIDDMVLKDVQKGEFVTRKNRKKWPLVLAGTLGMGLLVDAMYNWYSIHFSDPCVKITKVDRENGYTKISVFAQRYTPQCKIDFPIFGEVHEVKDDYRGDPTIIKSKCVIGPNTTFSTNRLELVMEGLKANDEVEFEAILDKDLPRGKFFVTKVSMEYGLFYKWTAGGQEQTVEKTFDGITGVEVEKGDQPVQIWGMMISNNPNATYPSSKGKDQRIACF